MSATHFSKLVQETLYQGKEDQCGCCHYNIVRGCRPVICVQRKVSFVPGIEIMWSDYSYYFTL
jgi:hypothetical protein